VAVANVVQAGSEPLLNWSISVAQFGCPAKCRPSTRDENIQLSRRVFDYGSWFFGTRNFSLLGEFSQVTTLRMVV
jgi:hypothetical protein